MAWECDYPAVIESINPLVNPKHRIFYIWLTDNKFSLSACQRLWLSITVVDNPGIRGEGGPVSAHLLTPTCLVVDRKLLPLDFPSFRYFTARPFCTLTLAQLVQHVEHTS